MSIYWEIIFSKMFVLFLKSIVLFQHFIMEYTRNFELLHAEKAVGLLHFGSYKNSFSSRKTYIKSHLKCSLI